MATALPEGAKLSVGTSVTTQSGVKWSMSMSGALHGRDLYASPNFVIKAKFQFMEEAEAETLETFLQTNRNSQIELVVRQYTYHAYLSGDVDRNYVGGEGVVSISAEFIGKKVA